MSGGVRRKSSQVPVSEFRPDLRPIALLRLSPGDLSKALDLEFEEEEDDLDGYQVAVLETPDGGQFALFRYHRSPSGAWDTEEHLPRITRTAVGARRPARSPKKK
jgi:hypothetical protein